MTGPLLVWAWTWYRRRCSSSEWGWLAVISETTAVRELVPGDKLLVRSNRKGTYSLEVVMSSVVTLLEVSSFSMKTVTETGAFEV